MLDIFRKRGIASFLYSALMGAVAVIFIIEFRPGANSSLGSLRAHCVAKVRGACVDEKDWRAQRYLLRGPFEQGPQVNYNKAAMDSLIERTLLEQEAERMGLRVTEDDVMQELIRDKVYIHVPVSIRAQARQLGIIPELGFRGYPYVHFGTKEKPFDQQTFEKVIRGTTGQSPDEFIDSQQHELLAQRVLDLVAERTRVSDDEAWEQYVAEKNTSTIRYVRFVSGYFSDWFVPAAPASIQKWAADNKDMVDTKEKSATDADKVLYRTRRILVDVKADATPEQKAEQKKKADDLLAQIKGGADFGALAKENSADVITKDKAGIAPWSSGVDVPPEVKDALGKMKVGDITTTESPTGFWIIQLVQKLEGRDAIAYPLYAAAEGDRIANETSKKYDDAIKAKLPVDANDSVVKAKIDEAKKTGKNDADATAQALDDEAKARMQKALDEALAALTPIPVAPPGAKAAAAAPAPAPTPAPAPAPDPWMSDDRRPDVEESAAFNMNGSPVIGLMDQQVIVDQTAKLTKEAPVAPPMMASRDLFVVVLKDRHEATREEFEKDKRMYLGAMLGKKREDAVVNYVESLRDALKKDELTIEQRYIADDKKQQGQGQGEQGPPPMEDEAPQ